MTLKTLNTTAVHEMPKQMSLSSLV